MTVAAGSGGVEVPSGVVVQRAAPLSPRARPELVPMRDGVRLATDVYLPQSHEGGLATVLIRLPYDKCGRYTFMPAIAMYLNENGFAAVIQDVRGKFRSEGALDPFVHEPADGYDTIEWITRQPWSNERVGMIGDSYYGFTQWAAVASGHPALRAIVPRVTGSCFFDAFATDAVPHRPFLEWLPGTWVIPELIEPRLLLDRPTPDGEILPAWTGPMRDRFPAFQEAAGNGTLLAATYPDGPPARRVEIPALHVGGWWDNLQRHQFDDWYDALQSPAREHQFLRMGATDHEDFQLREPGEPFANHEEDDEALKRYLPRMLDEPISFLRHYLGGASAVWPAPRVRFEVAHRGWESADRWPPPDSQELTLYLAAPAGLTYGPTLVGTAEWTHDPDDPVPYPIADEFGMLADLPDESPIHARADVASFTSPDELELPDLIGPVDVVVHIDAESPSTHVIARLHDVYPDGSARFIVGGSAVVDTTHGPAETPIRLGDVAYGMRPGHRLRLALSTSCVPLVVVHPGTGESPLTAHHRQRAAQTVHLGGPTASRIVIQRR